jgi:ATP-dependent Lhr-like helicase
VLDEALAGLSEEGSVVSGLLTEHAYEEQVCDRENMERLLRMARHERMPEFSPLPVEHLALFLADRHGLTRRQGSPEKLQQSIDRLFGYPAPAEAWEEWIFPSRLEPYYTAWTDSLFQSNGLGWAGCGKRRIMLGFPEDIDLFREHHDPESALTEIGRLFPDPSRPAAFFDIMKHTGADSTETSSMLWRAAWNGNVSADSFAVLRKGILNNYKATAAEASHESPFRRSSFNRWSASRPIAGTWRAFPGEYETDALIVEEMNRERVRFLFDRYGVLFREITLRESEPLQWRSIFRTLRLMELSGEALSGYFFRDVPGLQFVTHESLRALNSTLPHDAVWWVNATDPVSLCGMQIERMKELLPPRVKSNWIVYRGSELVMTVKRNGRDVLCYAESGDPLIPGYCRVFRDVVSREFNPVKSIHVETINGEPADKCEYAKPFVRAGFSVTYKGLELRKKY